MEKVLVLKSVNKNMSSGHDSSFIYPTSGEVVCPNFKNNSECGNGLHGWLWAIGDYSLKIKSINAKWLVIEVDKDSIIDLNGKVKFEKGNIIFCGKFIDAFKIVWNKYSENMTLESSASGIYGHASASGNSGHASASGHSGHASASGHSGHASASGHSGHASASGNSGHASASGYCGVACVLGNNGQAQCGENGSLILTYWDGVRYRHVVGYDGENGIEKGVAYRLNDNHEFEKVS